MQTIRNAFSTPSRQQRVFIGSTKIIDALAECKTDQIPEISDSTLRKLVKLDTIREGYYDFGYTDIPKGAKTLSEIKDDAQIFQDDAFAAILVHLLKDAELYGGRLLHKKKSNVFLMKHTGDERLFVIYLTFIRYSRYSRSHYKWLFKSYQHEHIIHLSWLDNCRLFTPMI